MGSEDKGISRETLKACDETFIIPMKGNFDSLNVSVAAGIICFEAMKQRGN
jgi:23S rRNA (guanosine2251-2'-O)-methyltransferase